MARLNIERQNKLTPTRMAYAIELLTSAGFPVEKINDAEIRFVFKGNTIKVFPFSGWFTGKGVKDGRGIENLLNQLK